MLTSSRELIGIKKMNAFTLVELIIVITILVVLATIAFISFQGYTKNSRDSNRLTTILNIQKGIDLFQVSSGVLPTPDNQYGTGTFNGFPLTQVGFIGEGVAGIIKINSTPQDPLSKTNYKYGVDTSKSKYQIATVLENTQANIWIETTYAQSPYQAKVVGNYEGLLKTGNSIYNLPSIITTDTGSYELTALNLNYVIDKGENLPYGIGNVATLNILNPIQVLQKLTNTGADLSITGVTIPTDMTTWNSLSGMLSLTLGYSVDVIGGSMYGNAYYTENGNISAGLGTIIENTCAIQPNYQNAIFVSGTPTQVNQIWQNTNSSNPCYFSCSVGYTGATCSNNMFASNTILLMHMNGVNGSTGFIDETGKSIQRAGPLTLISTGAVRFGSASTKFSGATNNYLYMNNPVDLNLGASEFTIEFWLKTEVNSNQFFMGNWAGPNYTRAVAITSTKITFYTSGNGSSIVTRQFPNAYPLDGQWHHIALSRVGNTIIGFFDGEMQTMSVPGITGSIFENSSNQFRIGAGYYINSFTGYLDEIRIVKGLPVYSTGFILPTSEFSN